METFAILAFLLSTLATSSRAGNQPPTLSNVISLLNTLNTKIDALTKKVDAIEKVIVTYPKAQDKHCADLYKKGHRKSDVYLIDPDGQGAFKARCDMATTGGGWTVFQRRLDGSVDFYRDWKDYKDGFGDPAGEFWLGLDKINRLTNSDRNVLRIDMEDTTGNSKYAIYNYFSVSSEKAKHQLGLGTYSGTAGDNLSEHRGTPFSTRDVDNDSSASSCAVAYKGAWWYTDCHSSNLNGYYYHGKHTSYADGINWRSWKGYHYSLKKTEMKVRPSGFPLNK